MTPDRWRQVESLCHAALARPPAERAAFLVDACGGDDTLRREIESLLAQEPRADGFMSAPAAVLATAILDQPNGALVGRRLGMYDVRSLLGVGGMGEVYRAYDDRLGREVAIKVLPTAVATDPTWRARLEREARMLASLNHPHIGAIYGIEDTEHIRALVLELVEGDTLAEHIARGRRASDRFQPLSVEAGGLSIDEALGVARQIIDALDAAHEKGIVHRDLKPANIKITPNGEVKVLDFGLAKSVVPDSQRSDLTASREVILGTASYMSPEQARGYAVDRRSDIWAFGCVLYEMLTGRLAFPGETVSDTIARILEREPDWSALPSATPVAIRRLLVRCLAKDPKRRFRDIADVRIELDAVDEVLPGVSDAPAARATPPSRRKSLSWVALAAVAAGVAVWEGSRAGAPENPLRNARFSRFTDWEGTEGGAQISPDGRFVAFVADRDGEFDLWVSQVGTGDFRNLTADVPALGAPHRLIRSFGFTGDGADVWFSVSSDPVLSRKMLVPLGGGTPRPFLAEGEAAPSWSADGTHLVFFKNALNDALFLADRTGGDPHQISIDTRDQREWSRGESRTHNHNMIWSSDDKWLYFVHGSARALNWTDDMDVWRVRPSGGSPERMTDQKTAITFLAPIDARTLLYVARGEDGSGPWLWALDVETNATRPVTWGLEQYTSVSASRDGRRVVATVASATANLWRVPILDRPAADRDVQPYRVPTVRALAPRFGGTTLFYLSSRGTADGLWRFQDGQAVELRKGVDGALFDPPAISRDVRGIAVIDVKERRRRLAVMSADGTGFRRLAQSIDVQGTVDWSPDGTWIVAGGRDDALGSGLFKIPVSGGAPVRLVAGQATHPVWSPDGTVIVYGGALVTGQIAPLLAVRPDGTPVEMPPVQVRPGGHRFLPNGTGVVYLPRNPSLDFWLLDLATKQTRQLTRLTEQGRFGTFDIAPAFDVTADGREIVFDRSRERSDIVLIDLAQ